MMLIKSCGICKESMISVENLEIEKWYDSGDTVTITRSSHHLVSLYPRKMVIIEDESYVDIHGFNVATLEIGNISPSAYVTCIYNSFWWVGMVSLVDIAAGDIIITDAIILMDQKLPLISLIVMIHVMLLWKTFKRYQPLLHLLVDPAFAKLQQ